MADDLSIEAVRSRLDGCLVGRDLRYFPVVDSTNRVAADLPPGDWSSGTVVIADFQEAGRGRSGRSWVAPAGSSVMLSVIFRRDHGIALADYVMMAALATRNAIADVAQLEVGLKWPNDVLVGDRKVAGILGESSSQNGVERVILGIGINVSFGVAAHAVLPDTATSLDLATGRSIDRDEMASGLMRALDLWYRGLTHRPDDVFHAWAAALDTVGLSVSIQDSDTVWSGIALGVRRDGGLLVETDSGSTRILYAGDVSVRHPGGFTAQ